MRLSKGLLGALVVSFALPALGHAEASPQRFGRTDKAATYHPDSVRVWFSPDGGCTEAIVEAINDAQRTIRVQAYSFTSAPIAAALVDAQKRGLDIAVILDRSQRTEKYSSADFVFRAGIPVWIDAKHAIAHNKVMVIDAKTVITGSFNFTASAEKRNAENLLIIQDAKMASLYLQNWDAHQAHSEVFGR